MFSVLDIKVTKDMTADDIKNYFRSLGFVGSKKLTGYDRIKMLEIAKKQGRKIRE